MGVTPPLRYIHIDDYSPSGIDNGPDDAAFANARADLAATGYRTLVIGRKQYWLQKGFNLNSSTDFNGMQYPALSNILITSDSFSGATSGQSRVFTGVPGTIILSPGFADPTVGQNAISGLYAYSGGSEPYRTTGSIRLGNSCGITNLRIMSLAAYQFSSAAAEILDSWVGANALVFGQSGSSMAAQVPSAAGMVNVAAGGGTAIQFDGDSCYVDNLLILGFRNQIVGTPLLGTNLTYGGPRAPRIGWIKSDAANCVRFDGCNQGAAAQAAETTNPSLSPIAPNGLLSGPFNNDNSLTAGITKGNSLSSITASSTTSSGFTLATTITNKTGSEKYLISPAFLSTGAPLKIVLSGIATGAAVYSPYNTNNLTPSGNPSNRFDAVIESASSTASGTTTLTLFVPDIPLNSLYDVTCTGTGTSTGSISGTNLVLAGGALPAGTIVPGDLVSGSGITSPLYVLDNSPVNSSTWTVSNSKSVSLTSLTFSSGASVTGSITTGANNLGAATLTLSGTTTGTVAVGQLVSGTGVLPGTTISSGAGDVWDLLVPQMAGPSLIYAFNGAVVEGTIQGTLGTTLSEIASIAGTIAVGQVVSGAGVPPGTAILGGTLTSWTVNNFAPTASGETLYLSNSTGSLTGTLQSSGTTTSFVYSESAGALSSGTALFGTAVCAGSYVQANSGSSGIGTATIGVLLSIGSASAPVTMIAQSGALIGGSIGSSNGTLSSTLSVAGTIAGSLAVGHPIIGVGVLPNTYLAGSLSSSNWSLNLAQLAPSDEVMIVPSGVATVSSVSGTVLTVYSSSGTAALSAGILTGSGVLPTTTITGTIATGSQGQGLYSVGVPQSVTSSLTLVPTAAFLGSISGTTLTISPTGTLAPGQRISSNFASAGTTISGTASLSSGAATYAISPSASGSIVGVITAPPTSSMITATIGREGPSTTMIVQSTGFGTPAVGQQVIGPGITAPTFITSVAGSPTLTVSTPCLVQPAEVLTLNAPSGAVFTGSLTSLTGTPTAGSLVVTSVSSGVLGVGHVLVGGDLPLSPNIYISGLGSGTAGGVGTYTVVQPSGTAISAPNLATMGSVPAPASFIGTLSGTSIVVPQLGTLASGSVIVGSGVAPGTSIGGAPTGNAYPISNSNSIYQNAGSIQYPELLTAVTSASLTSVTGSISGSTLSLASPALGLSPGMQVLGFGVLPGTTVVSVASGTLATVTVSQALSTAPIIALPATTTAVISGSISGTTLTGTVIAGTLVSGSNTILSGPGIPLGAVVTSASGTTGSITGTVSVAQYGSTNTVLYGAGNVLVGSIAGSILSIGSSSVGTSGTLTFTMLQGNGVLPGTNIVSGSSAPYTLAVAQSTSLPAGTQTMALLNPLYTSTGATTTLPTALMFSLAEVRPGCLIELNYSDAFLISGTNCYDVGTVIRLIDSNGIIIDMAHGDCTPPDMSATFLDLQGSSENIQLLGSSSVDNFTFINNNASALATASSSNLSLIGCSGGTSAGGTLLNQTGIGLHVSGCNFSQGLINIQTTSLVSFSATQFSMGGANSTPTTFAYGAGVIQGTTTLTTPSVVFDPSCQNPPPPP